MRRGGVGRDRERAQCERERGCGGGVLRRREYVNGEWSCGTGGWSRARVGARVQTGQETTRGRESREARRESWWARE